MDKASMMDKAGACPSWKCWRAGVQRRESDEVPEEMLRSGSSIVLWGPKDGKYHGGIAKQGQEIITEG